MSSCNSHLRRHGDATEEEDETDGQRGEEADTLVESKSRKLVNKPGHHCLDQHHLRTVLSYSTHTADC